MRVHEWNSNVYVLRGKRDACEYAVLSDGYPQWKRTHEGVLFDDIEPFSTAKEWRSFPATHIRKLAGEADAG